MGKLSTASLEDENTFIMVLVTASVEDEVAAENNKKATLEKMRRTDLSLRERNKGISNSVVGAG
jgi:hypothetical protein